MGSSLGRVFVPSNLNCQLSESTRTSIVTLFSILKANPRINFEKLDILLLKIPKSENILLIKEDGYNLLQRVIGLGHIDLLKWILSRNPDLNRYPCSLPLHIACKRGILEAVELLLKHGARSDLEARMCFPYKHNFACEMRNCNLDSGPLDIRSTQTDRVQNGIFYSLDGDHPAILELLTKSYQTFWFWPLPPRRPLLHIACERGSWACATFLIDHRPEEINECYDEYFPIHQAIIQDMRFTEVLLLNGAQATVKTTTQQMNVLHILFLLSKKSAEDTLQHAKLFIDYGLREIINEADSLSNTPLHACIIRYALEETGIYQDYVPWTKYDMFFIVRFLLSHGGRKSINQSGNSALATVLRHVRDWEFRYELLSMLLQEGGDPNIVGRDGSVPLMVCLVPLINKDLLHNCTHNMKVFYVNCVRILLKYGASPNCVNRSNLSPLHVLLFAAGEYMALSNLEEKDSCFAFIKQLLVLLLQHGLDANIQYSSRTQHTGSPLLGLLELVLSVRDPRDLDYIYDLSLTMIQGGARPNIDISFEMSESLVCQPSSNYSSYNHNNNNNNKKSSNKLLYYYIQWLYRKEHLLLDSERRFAKLIRLYANCMDHKDLQNILKLIYTQSAIFPVRTALCSVLKEFFQPQTLQHQARLSIYKVCHPTQFNRLPIPQPIIKYLLSFD